MMTGFFECGLAEELACVLFRILSCAVSPHAAFVGKAALDSERYQQGSSFATSVLHRVANHPAPAGQWKRKL